MGTERRVRGGFRVRGKGRKPPKTTAIQLRIVESDKAWIREIASIKRMSLSAFIRWAAEVQARRVLSKMSGKGGL